MTQVACVRIELHWDQFRHGAFQRDNDVSATNHHGVVIVSDDIEVIGELYHKVTKYSRYLLPRSVVSCAGLSTLTIGRLVVPWTYRPRYSIPHLTLNDR